ncbi:esterase/lipase family protein [Alicyclobacillus acidocaldarius]|uniref:PGAP1 family protein n=1 Tax=Alicyclobacillus acidocaldarius (strain Tc-4-1) TaxID=1048834 RepID=F8IJ01_ALIAT|nr:alpha/beta fold hydrolase [Alicyclobacillus acidocaldarius]AEJ42152.1 PGAP1 family protein [Alicyclobacillus acidocaldarius subsp. acidocaldarius Tc-4-1]
MTLSLQSSESVKTIAPKTYPLVLIHGLRNAHRWTEAFLRRCLAIWGSDRVFVVHLNRSDRVWSEEYPEGYVHFAGTLHQGAGCDTVERQFEYLCRKLDLLEAQCGLTRPFDVIAHSMGGLVLRRYASEFPSDVAAAVTLGTPYGGAPMARDFLWFGYCVGAGRAFRNLTPRFVQDFVRRHPWPSGVPLYTVRGIHRGVSWGVGGELFIGTLYHFFMRRSSDGLVPVDHALCPESQHLADLADHNHLHLVSDPKVADLCASVLP